MKISDTFIQDTITTFNSLYGITISPEEAKEIILNCKALLETLGKNPIREEELADQSKRNIT